MDATRLLYMEDDPAVARLLQKTLTRQGYHIDIANDGVEGLTMIGQNRYDAVIVDYSMPNFGGLEVIGSLAGMKESPPVIMLTGNGNEQVAVEALKLGAVDYLVKDVEMTYLELLPMIVEQVLRNQQLVAERLRMVDEIRESEERYRRLVELSPDGIALSEEGRFVFVNPAGVALLKAPDAMALQGMKVSDFIHPQWQERVNAQFPPRDQGGLINSWLELKMVRFDKQEIDAELSGVPFVSHGEPALQIIFRDITERKQDKLRLEQLAHYDMLTGLPNRAYFFDHLAFIHEHSRRYQNQFALLFMDLDGFKAINDKFGHDIGDLLLQEAGARLQGALRKSDLLARVGGDEFTAILPKVNGALDAAIAANKLLEVISHPFVFKGISCSVGISIGISIYPGDAVDSGPLLKRADTAMYLAKDQGKNRYQLASAVTAPPSP